MNLKLLYFFIIITAISCNSQHKNSESAEVKTEQPEETDNTDGLSEYTKEFENYQNERDLDGDGIFDYIHFDYSGGAHCCYYLEVKLSSQSDTVKFPFPMDGGYPMGTPDGSSPYHFSIDDFLNNGLDAIYMKIYTYNGQPDSIPKEVQKKYKIKTHDILIYFEDDSLKVKDFQIPEGFFDDK